MKNPTPKKAKGPTVPPVGALRKKQTQLKFSAKSTATEAQRQRIVIALRIRPRTSYELRRMGCYQSAARIKELKDRFGYQIETSRVTLVDRDGYTHRGCALYTLVAEPDGERSQ